MQWGQVALAVCICASLLIIIKSHSHTNNPNMDLSLTLGYNSGPWPPRPPGSLPALGPQYRPRIGPLPADIIIFV